MGSFRPLTIPPNTHLLGLLAILYDDENVVLTNFEEACEFRISHQGASVSSIKFSKGSSLTTFKLSSVFNELKNQ